MTAQSIRDPLYIAFHVLAKVSLHRSWTVGKLTDAGGGESPHSWTYPP